jgi:hypothetical protein
MKTAGFSEAYVWRTAWHRNREDYNLNIRSNVGREGRMRAFATVFDSVFCLRLFQ